MKKLFRIENEHNSPNLLWETTFDAINEAMVILSPEGRVMKCNQKLKTFLGKKEEEIINKTGQEIFKEFFYLETDARFPQMKEKQARNEFVTGNKDRWFKVSLDPIHGEEEGFLGTVCIITDITKQKQDEEVLDSSKKQLEQTLNELQTTQAQIIQSEKMASIGQLAAGMAHEINNPTGFVGSNLNTLSDYHKDITNIIKMYRNIINKLKEIVSKEPGLVSLSGQVEEVLKLENEIDLDFILDDSSDLINESIEGTDRIKKIVIDLKDFAHPRDNELQPVQINDYLESTLNIIWNELKYKATLVKEYGDIPQIYGYPGQLNQVFMNLLVNAAQAIEKQGEIRISTRTIDDCIEIKISDTGTGIKEEHLSKIYEPFFTTKEVGKGSGLGLHIVYNIVKKHDGTVDVDSAVGKGTTFTIKIPIRESLDEFNKEDKCVNE